MIETSKRVPVGATAAVLVVLAAAVGGALLFGGGATSTASAAASPAGALQDAIDVTSRWRGMELVPTQSPQAEHAGVPLNADGVLVAGLPENDPRARRAGLMPGDLVVGLDGTDVLDIGDLFDAAKQVDPQRAVSIDIVRQGQPLTLVLPPATPAPAGARQPEPRDTDGLRFVCPQDGSTWLGEQVAPSYRCFRCGGPLVRAR